MEVAEDEKLVVDPPGPKRTASADAVPGMDGTAVLVRKEELVDRRSSKREVTLVTIWKRGGRDKEGSPEQRRRRDQLLGAIESAAPQEKSRKKA